jgi:hypothetical protein
LLEEFGEEWGISSARKNQGPLSSDRNRFAEIPLNEPERGSEMEIPVIPLAGDLMN